LRERVRRSLPKVPKPAAEGRIAAGQSVAVAAAWRRPPRDRQRRDLRPLGALAHFDGVEV